MGGLISLDDAKLQVRTDDDSEDALLASYIAAAGVHVERLTGIVCPKRAAEPFVLDSFPCRNRPIILRLLPVDPDSIAISYIDGSGASAAFTDFRTWEKNGLTHIGPDFGSCWPRTACLPGAVTITADVGYDGSADASADTDAPDNVKHAVRLLVGGWYRFREPVNPQTVTSEIPLSVTDLLEHERPRRV